MNTYVKPNFFTTEFEVNQAIAGCERVVTGTQTNTVYDQQSVRCIIGNQNETVFNSASGCSTSATKWGVTEYEGDMYFVWFTYAGDTGGSQPSGDLVNTLDDLVKQLGFDSGSGWHYAKVTGTDIVTDVLGFSY